MFVRSILCSCRPLLAGAALAMASAISVQAQEVDLGAAERLFGEPVTTSATGKPQRVSEVPVNMDIITQDDIRRSGATTIPDVLQWVAGVDVRRYGIADEEVGIRGYNQPYNPRLLVLVNGRQVYSDDYGHVSWPTIPVQLDEIRQIEVIKGPNSALYGFNAVGGVINIITYDPLHDRVNSATLRGGSQDYLGGSVVGTGKIGDDAGVRVSAGGFRAQDFAPGALAPADAINRAVSPRVGAFNLDARANIAPGVETFVEASMADTGFAEKNFFDVFDTQYSRTNSARVGINADTGLGLLSLSAYRNEQLLSLDAVTLASLVNWAKEDVYVVQASDLLKFGADHTFRVGVEYRNNAVTAPGFLSGTAGYADYAANLMWDWAITPRLSLTNAVRIDDLALRYSGVPATGTGLTVADYNRTSFAVPSFNSGLVFRATELDTFRLTAARGVQLPSLVDFGVQVPPGIFGPVIIAGNPDLRPSTVDNLEFDYDRTVPEANSTIRLALFAQQTRDVISVPSSATPAIGPTGLVLLMPSNIGNTNALGAELGLKGHSANGFRWSASYAFVETTNGTTLGIAPITTNPVDLAHAVPRNVITAGIGYSRGKLELDLMGRWQSSYLDLQSTGVAAFLQPVEIDNYITLNGRVGYRLTDNVTLALTAQQFNTSRLLQAAGPPIERRIIASLTAHF